MPDIAPHVSTQQSPVDPSIDALVELFAGPLARVSFPEVDHAILKELVTSVQRAVEDVSQARAMLHAVEETLRELDATDPSPFSPWAATSADARA